MAIILLDIAAAAALLIWAVRVVRTGVERAFSNQLRLWLRLSSGNRLFAFFSGLSAAVLLQSSTAVAVLVSNFVAKNGLPVTVGLAMLLGADVGSAVVSQLLLLRQAWFVPLLILLGVILFFRGYSSNTRQLGRIMIGLALIFLSLDMISQATVPMVTSQSTQAVMQYLGNDLVAAFIMGAVFAWAVHSSVAAVLLYVTLASQSILSVEGAAAMVLGANLGGALIAYVLTSSSTLAGRQVVIGNVLVRGAGALIALLIVRERPELLQLLGTQAANQAINLHLLFNGLLALISLPLVKWVAALVAKLVVDRNASVGLEEHSALNSSALVTPDHALHCSTLELLRMGQKVEQMLRAIEPLYDHWDQASASAIKEQDRMVKDMHLELKLYLARLGQGELNEAQSRRGLELMTVSSNLEAASDVIKRSMLQMAKRLDVKGLSFSAKGRQEIHDFSDRVLNNIHLAANVMMNQRSEQARELVMAKEKARAVEQKLQRNHLGRLREGHVESIETSNIHQETLRSLKQVNNAFSSIGYAVLSRSGELLDSRLTDA